MSNSFAINQLKKKLTEVDYRERLSLVYQWTKTDHINKSEFIDLINYSVNLDLLPTED